VEQIFFNQPKVVEAVARKLANFFEKLLELQRKKNHVDDRVLEELPYAILKTNDVDWLKDILLDCNVPSIPSPPPPNTLPSFHFSFLLFPDVLETFYEGANV